MPDIIVVSLLFSKMREILFMVTLNFRAKIVKSQKYNLLAPKYFTQKNAKLDFLNKMIFHPKIFKNQVKYEFSRQNQSSLQNPENMIFSVCKII